MQSGSTSRWSALAGLLRPDAYRWLLLALLIAASSALSLGGPLVVRRVVDEATAGTTTNNLTRLAVLYLAIALATQAAAVAVVWYATIAAWRTTNGLRLQMTRHVLGLDHEFHRSHTPGELIQRVDGDITSVSDFLSKVVPKAAGALLLVLGMVIVLGFLDWRLGLGMATYLAMSVGVVIRSRHRAVSESSDEMNSLARLYGGIEERLTAAEDLRSNGAANHVAWRFVEDSSDALASSVRRERAFLIMWWFVQGTVAAGWVIVLILGAILVAGNVITVGTAFLLFQYVLLISRPLEEVVHQLETVQKANGAMVRVIDLLAIRPKILDNGSTSPARGPLSVECHDVHFDYEDAGTGDANDGDAGDKAAGNHVSGGEDTPAAVNGQRVLHDVDLNIGAGRSVGIVGRTGSGKTTLSRLVLRLVEATAGDVLLGGVPIAEIPLAELRHRVALVPQEVELFAGTIRDNITLFDDTRADAAVIAALRGVGLDVLANGGIHRSLGAGGAGLSAGEAQLLALARVWLRDPDLLVLDEATARVDPQTEQQLEAAIAALMAGRTTLVIAHRLSTLRSVDDIIVFDHGRIVEAGPRSELVGDDDSRFNRLLTLALENEDPLGASAPDESSEDAER